MERSAVVVGASGAVGESVATHLLAAGLRVTATMRRESAGAASRLENAGAKLARLDLEKPISPALFEGADAVVLTPILKLSVRALNALRAANVPRVIAFSSNNVAIDLKSPTYTAL